ncbi:cytochrome p450 cyp749a22 [Quercus suber]|uniref:Cytochrome p450 cyp749a22 n=1 Tax=Quercus suber TaxID=58331 RepID=A0AAW0JNV4_QUESU
MEKEKMGAIGIFAIFLSSSLCLYFVLALIRFVHKLWWNPIRIQHQMRLQGIPGPSYRFLHGSNNDILNMKNEAKNRPMGLSHDLMSKVQPHIHSWVNKYEPPLIKEILNNRDSAYPKEEAKGYMKRLFGDGLSVSEGEKWTKMKKLANHAFHAESLKNMIPTVITSVEEMLERWKQHEGKEIEIFEEFRVFTSEVISKTAFGSSYVEGRNIFQMLMKLASITATNAYTHRFPGISKIYKTNDEIESEELDKGIRQSILEMIKKREMKVTTREVGSSTGDDFLEILLKAHRDANPSRKISVQDMVDECKTFYIAGQETTTTLLAWTVFLLAIHTDWQEKARKEVLEFFGQQNPNPDGIAKLKTMSMIINESLRLYTPALSILRKVEREARLGKLILPANLLLFIAPLAIHHDPQIWGEDVHLFKPERFSEGVAKATNNNIAAFFPFGMGPRICVGMNFATNEAKIALSMILQRFAFTLSPTYVHSPIQNFTLRPQHGIQVLLHSL